MHLLNGLFGDSFFKYFRSFAGGKRTAEVETLSVVAAVTPKEIELRFCFDSFRDDAVVKTFADVDHRRDDRCVLWIVGDFMDEGLMEL